MSASLREFSRAFVEPLIIKPHDEARAEFMMLALTVGDIDSRSKGADIGRVVIEGLMTLGKRPNHPPLFSVDDQYEKLDGFVEQFGVTRLHRIANSLPVLTAGCTFEIEEVYRWSNLTVHEQGYGGVLLPAVRLHFVPNEL